MHRLLFISAFLLGAIAIIWMGSYFLGSDALALSVTLVIGCVYTIGFVELLQFRRATATLSTALHELPEQPPTDSTFLQTWIGKLHPSLHNAVRQRVQGERVGLPAPVITPYLVGLLVMLGLLGTFVGMVETLKGAVLALEGTTELQAIRAGLAAPIKGLSLAFGTSVAGVAASAMLGLASTLSRRDRMLATRDLDGRIANVLREFSLGHQREQTYKVLQQQADALPAVADKLSSLADKLESMSESLGDRLLANQGLFHKSVERSYTELASSVDKSLTDSLSQSARLAGESIKPHLIEAMEGMSSEAGNTRKELTQASLAHFHELNGKFEAVTNDMLKTFEQSSNVWLEQQQTSESQRLSHWQTVLGDSQEQALTRITSATEALGGEFRDSAAAQQASLGAASRELESLSSGLGQQWQQAGTRLDAAVDTLSSGMEALRQNEEENGRAALERLASLESTVASHLGKLGQELEAPMTRLIETASETPRAAAEVIGKLREELSNNLERDNTLLEERGRIMSDLNALTQSLQESVGEQRDSITQMVSSSTELLRETSTGFGDQIQAQLSKVSLAAEGFTLSSTEMASLAEGFGVAVGVFNQSNSSLIEQLVRIGDAMDQSSSRSDEQMGYYVEQAREIIDQSLASQREVFEELKDLGQQATALPAEAS